MMIMIVPKSYACQEQGSGGSEGEDLAGNQRKGGRRGMMIMIASNSHGRQKEWVQGEEEA